MFVLQARFAISLKFLVEKVATSSFVENFSDLAVFGNFGTHECAKLVYCQILFVEEF